MTDKTERTIDMRPGADLSALSDDELLEQAYSLRTLITSFEDAADVNRAWVAYDARQFEHTVRRVAHIPAADTESALTVGRQAGMQQGIKRGWAKGYEAGLAKGEQRAVEKRAADGEETQVIERDAKGAVVSITTELGSSGDVEVKRIERDESGRIIRTQTSVTPAP